MRKAFCLVYLVGHAIAAWAQPEPLQLPTAIVGGATQAEWSQRWWQWAGRFERSESPVSDRTGARCQAGQSGAVWFLAGTYGSRRVTRTCSVPAGQYLFFPLLNYVVYRGRDSQSPCEVLARTARSMTDDPSSLLLEIDGQRFGGLENHRQASLGCFEMPNSSFPAAANGYYVMVAPLSRGTHALNFGGSLPSLAQAVTYTLTVE